MVDRTNGWLIAHVSLAATRMLGMDPPPWHDSPDRADTAADTDALTDQSASGAPDKERVDGDFLMPRNAA